MPNVKIMLLSHCRVSDISEVERIQWRKGRDVDRELCQLRLTTRYISKQSLIDLTHSITRCTLPLSLLEHKTITQEPTCGGTTR